MPKCLRFALPVQATLKKTKIFKVDKIMQDSSCINYKMTIKTLQSALTVIYLWL